MTTKQEEEVEYQVRPCKIVGLRRRSGKEKELPWRQGKLVREWKNGSASIRTELTGDGWLIIRPGEWRRVATPSPGYIPATYSGVGGYNPVPYRGIGGLRES